eukprot:gene8889-biopygen19680
MLGLVGNSGLVWSGLVWSGLVWSGLVWSGWVQGQEAGWGVRGRMRTVWQGCSARCRSVSQKSGMLARLNRAWSIISSWELSLEPHQLVGIVPETSSARGNRAWNLISSWELSMEPGN